MLSSWRSDLSAGAVVFLVALPLCLGIALASGAPLFAGVIAGIVGGTLVGILSGSNISVSGPAAGLAVVVAAAIPANGGYERFVAAVVLSGIIQIGFAILRLGIIGDYVPNSVVKGMLAAIGIAIILKQIPHALGRDDDFEGDLAFLGAHDNTFTDIVKAVLSANAGAVTLTIVCLAILILWQHRSFKKVPILSMIPGPLVAVLAGIGLNEAFRLWMPGLAVTSSEHLVRLPVSESIPDFFRQFSFPDFSVLTSRQVYITAITIAVIGSIESLFALEAADRLDPYKRTSPTNRELFAQGAGNIVSGLVGGLPVTSVALRTSANVYAGARTKVSTIFHGMLLLVSAMLFPSALNKLPLAVLAAILFVIGYKLASVKVFREMYRHGIDQFLPFIVTVIAVVLTDLLIGVLIGLAVGLVFVLRANRHVAITQVNQDNHCLLRLNKDMTFINKSAFKTALRNLPDNSHVIIDGSRALYVDKDIYDTLDDFRESCEYRHIEVELKNFERRNGAETMHAAVETSK